jgi:hypothetical protein
MTPHQIVGEGRRARIRAYIACVAGVMCVLGLALTSSAQAATTCAHAPAGADGVEVELTVWGHTSCRMGKATVAKVLRLGYAPRRMRVKSPVTHRTYSLRRAVLEGSDTGDSYWSFVYVNHARGINVQLQVWY